jgi:hypothetical protein
MAYGDDIANGGFMAGFEKAGGLKGIKNIAAGIGTKSKDNPSSFGVEGNEWEAPQPKNAPEQAPLTSEGAQKIWDNAGKASAGQTAPAPAPAAAPQAPAAAAPPAAKTWFDHLQGTPGWQNMPPMVQQLLTNISRMGMPQPSIPPQAKQPTPAMPASLPPQAQASANPAAPLPAPPPVPPAPSPFAGISRSPGAGVAAPPKFPFGGYI